MEAPKATAQKAPRTGGVRFAPSPTGRFHVGNLRTAWIAQSWAKTLALLFVVRVEDIDKPRVLPGAREEQLADMKVLGIEPDVLLIQSQFHGRHWQLFEEGVKSGQIYPCDCSRKEVQTALAGLASAPHDGEAPVYTGHCRALGKRELAKAESIGWRFRMSAGSGQDDFIIARTGPALDANGFPDRSTFVPAYHWACAIDDYDGGYDILVRSIDLLPAMKVQFAIQTWAAQLEANAKFKLPSVFHTALVVQDDGSRLEKRTKGVTLPDLEAKGVLPSQLTELFQASFNPRVLLREPAPGALLREEAEQLTLSELWIKPGSG